MSRRCSENDGSRGQALGERRLRLFRKTRIESARRKRCESSLQFPIRPLPNPPVMDRLADCSPGVLRREIIQEPFRDAKPMRLMSPIRIRKRSNEIPASAPPRSMASSGPSWRAHASVSPGSTDAGIFRDARRWTREYADRAPDLSPAPDLRGIKVVRQACRERLAFRPADFLARFGNPRPKGRR